MSYGIKVINTNGKTIISDTTVNPIFRGKAVHSGELALSNGVAGHNNKQLPPISSAYLQTFSFTCAEDIIPFVRSATGASFGLHRIAQSGASWAIYIHTEVPQSSAQLHVYIFSAIPDSTPIPTSGYGANILRSNGKLAFATSLNSLAPVGAKQTNIPGAYPSPLGSFVQRGVLYEPVYVAPFILDYANYAPYSVTSGTSSTSIALPPSAATNLPLSDTLNIVWGIWEYTTFPSAAIYYYRDVWATFCSLSSQGVTTSWRRVSRVYLRSINSFNDYDSGGAPANPINYDYTLFIDGAHYD